MSLIGLVLAAALAAGSGAQDPLLRAWLVNPPANPSMKAVLPDVHAVESRAEAVFVRSAGLTVNPLGALEANEHEPPSLVRRLEFRIPRNPRPAGQRVPVAPGIIGALVNGMPLYNPASAASYNNQNLWHCDAVARERSRPTGTSVLLDTVLRASDRHSPILGYALDGYPIYGPYGFDAAGKVRRMRSSYRLRSQTARLEWPDGTKLAPWQAGPAPDANAPAGTFVEDYEYAAGSGDLDESNARFGITPEYPAGTWAYFVAIDEVGELAYPYAVGPVYRGVVAVDGPAQTPARAGTPHRLFFDPRLKSGKRPLYLEKVHEQPLHVLIASEDLSEFAHIHPAPVTGRGFAIEHTFPFGGRYHVYADYSLPGEGPVVRHEVVTVEGAPRPAAPLRPDGTFVDGVSKESAGMRVTLAADQPLRAGVDLTLSLKLSDAATGQPVADLDPYLGAWAHVVVLSRDGADFLHAHPLEAAGPGFSEGFPHAHAAISSPSPATIRTVTGFRRAGLYKLWVQARRRGQVIAVPFVLDVAPAATPVTSAPLPAGAIRVLVSGRGYEPAMIPVAAEQRVRLAFLRQDAQNCGATLTFPELRLTRTLTAGKPELVEFTAPQKGVVAFACGMGMLRGSVVVTGTAR